MITEKQLRKAPKGDYMNPDQQAFFKHQLLSLKQETQNHIEQIKQQLAQPPECNDEADRAQKGSADADLIVPVASKKPPIKARGE